MPAIPLYQQQTTPDGTLNARALPAEGGAEVIRAVGDTLGKVGEVVQREGLRKIQEEKALVQERLKANEDDARFWAARVLSETELTAKSQLENMEVTRAPDDYGIAPQFIQWGEGFTAERLKHAPSPLHRKFAELGMRQLFDRTAARAMDLDKQYESRRMAWNFTQAVDASAKVLQSSDTETLNDRFKEQMGRLGSLMKGIPGSETNRGLNLDPWTRDQLLDQGRGDLVMRSGERQIEVDPDEFLRLVGANDEGVPEVGPVAAPTSGPIGVRLHNPGNVKVNPDNKWQGAIGSEGEFVRFATPEHGIRAAARVLMNYGRRGINTPSTIAATYAPEKDNNDPVGYAAKVSTWLGITPDTRLDMQDEETLTRLVTAHIRAEGNNGPYSAEQIQRGVRAALGKEKLGEAPSPERINKAPIEAPSWWQVATAEERDKLLDFGRRASEQLRAERADSLRTWLQNAEALAKAGQVPQGAPSLDEAVRIYGPDRGRQVYEQGQSFVRLGRNIGGLADASDEDIARRLERMKPNPKEQDTFAVRQGAYQDLAQAAEAVQKERRKKPLEWALIHNPTVNKAARTLAQTMENPAATPEQKAKARADYASKAKAAQRRYGATTPTLLTESQADGIADAFNDPRNYERAADMIQALQAEWGEEWPTVYQQLSKQLPPTADVIASGLPRKTAANLARLAPLKLEDMRKAAAPDVRSSVKQSLDVAFEPFARSLLFQEPTEGRGKADRFRNEAEKLALHYVGQGMHPADAAASAATELTGNYNFVQQDGLVRDPAGGRYGIAPVYRVPKALDQGEVERGAKRLRSTLDGRDLQVPGGIPPETYASEARDRGYWVTSPDESGLELHYAGDPVNRADGTPVRVTWSDLQTAAGPGFWGSLRDFARREAEGMRKGPTPPARPEGWTAPSDASSQTPYRPIFTETPVAPASPDQLFR